MCGNPRMFLQDGNAKAGSKALTWRYEISKDHVIDIHSHRLSCNIMHVLLKALSWCTGARPQQPYQPSQKKWRFQQARCIFARRHYQQIIELHRIQWEVPARFSSLTNPESRTPESTINWFGVLRCPWARDCPAKWKLIDLRELTL